MVSRRSMIAGGAGAAAALALGYRAWDRGVFSSAEGPAYAPWGEWPQAAEGIKGAVRAAILAANAHDTQPWRFALFADGIDVYADRARHLGTFDPFRREMHLSLGAAIANLLIAAGVNGLSLTHYAPTAGRLDLSPDDAPILAGRLRLARTGQSPAQLRALAQAIPLRHTNRGAYEPEHAIAQGALDAVAAPARQQDVSIVFVTDPSARKELAALIVEATQRIIDDSAMSADSARWFRTSADEVLEHRDGITIDASGASPMLRAMAKLMPDLGAAATDRQWNSQWLSMTRDTQVASAPVLGIVLVKDRFDMAAALSAGQAWQLMHLAATSLRLAAQPLNQPVECMDRNAMLGRADQFGPALAKLAKIPGWEPTFVFRLGVPTEAALPSPRRPLSEVLVRRA